eukprot:scpid89338/ scgid16207/ 
MGKYGRPHGAAQDTGTGSMSGLFFTGLIVECCSSNSSRIISRKRGRVTSILRVIQEEVPCYETVCIFVVCVLCAYVSNGEIVWSEQEGLPHCRMLQKGPVTRSHMLLSKRRPRGVMEECPRSWAGQVCSCGPHLLFILGFCVLTISDFWIFLAVCCTAWHSMPLPRASHTFSTPPEMEQRMGPLPVCHSRLSSAFAPFQASNLAVPQTRRQNTDRHSTHVKNLCQLSSTIDYKARGTS